MQQAAASSAARTRVMGLMRMRQYNPAVSHVEHKAQAPTSIGCYVLTVSDTRTPETDSSGNAIRELLAGSGHVVTGGTIVPDEPDAVLKLVEHAIADPATQVIITTGGTGISSRDGTYEVIDQLLDKRLDGFGELFRMLSFAEIGSAAMLSRATAGTASGKAIFVLPGSQHAVRLAMTKLILPELGHVVQQVTR
jgi:molybdenum cofactor biosynthesis protein B